MAEARQKGAIVKPLANIPSAEGLHSTQSQSYDVPFALEQDQTLTPVPASDSGAASSLPNKSRIFAIYVTIPLPHPHPHQNTAVATIACESWLDASQLLVFQHAC